MWHVRKYRDAGARAHLTDRPKHLAFIRPQLQRRADLTHRTPPLSRRVGDQLLDDLHRIRHLPATIVQGRYDMVCPPVTADLLARAWPEAEYVVVPDAGHSAMESGIRAALVTATERYRTLAAS